MKKTVVGLLFAIFMICSPEIVAAQLRSPEVVAAEYNDAGKVLYADYKEKDLPILAQIVIVTKAVVFDFQCIPAPGNPPTGNLRLYCDSGTGQLTTISSSGTSTSLGGSTSPSSLGGSGGYFTALAGFKPEDCGNPTCTQPVSSAIQYLKFCYDGQSNSTTTFKSLATATITNTALTSNLATYTISSAQPLSTGELVTVTGTTNGGGVFNITNQPIANYSLGTTSFTVNITNANIGSAADTGTATASCAGFTAANATNVIEILVGGVNTALDVSTTISTVTNGSTVVLAGAPGTHANVKFWYGTDATVPVRNWVTAINNGIPTATGLLAHSGYVPGMYLVTKPLRFANPLMTLAASGGGFLGTTGAGFATPEPFSSQNAGESLSITGQGSYRSGFVASSNFNMAADGTGLNTGLLYYGGWNGPVIQNIAIIQADRGFALNTSTMTGIFGLKHGDSNGHSLESNLQIENAHNTTGSLIADQMQNGCYECYATNVQYYNNDCNSNWYGTTQIGSQANTWDHIQWYPGQGTGCAQAATLYYGGQPSRDKIANSVISGTNSVSNIKFSTAFTAGLTDGVVFSNDDIPVPAGGFGIIVAGGSGLIDLQGTKLYDAGAGGTTNLILVQGGTARVKIAGGMLGCLSAGVGTTCANGISNSNGGSVIFGDSNVNEVGTIGRVGTGASSIFTFSQSATGWTGAGTLQSTQYIANQGTVCTNGELALSAGWQSTGAATVTAVAGTGQTCSWTITTGTTTAANPTVTDTLTNVLPAATTVCWMTVYGGTHVAVAGESLRQTTLSATAPVFTANFTPTPAGTTYFVTRTCGP